MAVLIKNNLTVSGGSTQFYNDISESLALSSTYYLHNVAVPTFLIACCIIFIPYCFYAQITILIHFMRKLFYLDISIEFCSTPE